MSSARIKHAPGNRAGSGPPIGTILDATFYTWRCRLRHEAGAYVVNFPDFPSALTDGADVAEALANACDALSVEIMERLKHGEPVPPPNRARRGEYQVAPTPTVALKLALLDAVDAQEETVSGIARRLDLDRKEVRRLLDPGFPSKTPRLVEALQALGRSVVVGSYRSKPIARKIAP
jgi:antitoxin HicB